MAKNLLNFNILHLKRSCSYNLYKTNSICHSIPNIIQRNIKAYKYFGTFRERYKTEYFLSLRKNTCYQICTNRTFRTTEVKRIYPALWIVLKPLLKLTAALSGRGVRKWWKDLPPNKKKYFLNLIKQNRRKIGIYFSVVILLALGYYLSHLEEAPITKRLRFMAFNTEQMEKINQYELQHIMDQVSSHILPPNHPACKRVAAIVRQILEANSDIEQVKDKTWGITVIDSNIENAFVLPIGHVFVFTGILKICNNDDQLGTVLAHEIAHCIQNHGAENVSHTHILDLFSILIIALIWAILPSDIISLLTHWLYHKLIDVLLQLPYNRKLETEADYIGLQLAAKACFDVRESSAFWSKMAFLNKTFGKDPQIEFLSTHPNHDKRSEYLDSIMDHAMKLRQDCNCPILRNRDPRIDVESVSKALQRTRNVFFENNPKQIIVFKV